MGLYEQLNRYLGRRVSVSTYGHGKLVGRVKSIDHEYLKLVDCQLLGELDEQGWFAQMQHADPDSDFGPRNPEAVIQLHVIISVTCFDEEITTVPEPGEELPLAVTETVEPPRPEDTMEESLTPYAIGLQLGVGLIQLAAPDKGGDLLSLVTSLRPAVCNDWGFIFPLVHISDNIQFPMDAYSISIHGCEVARGEIRPDRLLAIANGSASNGELTAQAKAISPIAGDPTTDPAFGQPAIWIDKSDRERAELAGYAVYSPSMVLTVHLREMIRTHLTSLLSYETVSQLVDVARRNDPVLVNELVPQVITIRTIYRVLYRLLEEGVPLLGFAKILEALGDTDETEIEALVAHVRRRLGAIVCRPHLNDDRSLSVIRFDEPLQTALQAALAADGVALPGEAVAPIVECWRRNQSTSQSLVVLAPAELRVAVSRTLRKQGEQIPVLGDDETPSHIELNTVDVVAIETTTPAPSPAQRIESQASVQNKPR